MSASLLATIITAFAACMAAFAAVAGLRYARRQPIDLQAGRKH